MSKLKDKKEIQPRIDTQSLPDMSSRYPAPAPSKEPHDPRKFRRETKELQLKNYEKGDKK